MSEWHITPDYIVNNWTDELLDLMMAKLIERKRRERKAIEGRSSGKSQSVSVEALAAVSRGQIKVVKHGN